MRVNILLFFAGLSVVQPLLSRCPCAALEIIEHFGTCDASAGAAVGTSRVVIASDEDNVLRVYRTDTCGMPVHTLDLTFFLEVNGNHPEADIEGVATVGNRVYWITSHGTNRKGHQRPNRHRLFATDIYDDDNTVLIKPVGIPYGDLVRDLATAPQLKGFRLGDAAKRPPKEWGGLNIEGLCATPEGGLLIAFRNPVPKGMALLVPLENPEEVIMGQRARLGNPICLPLGGLGIRAIAYVETQDTYLIIAGPPGQEAIFGLYQWSGNPSAPPTLVDGVSFNGLQPEGLVVFPSAKPRALVLSDDGIMHVEGGRCKDVPPKKRFFRTFWVTHLPPHPSTLNGPSLSKSLGVMPSAHERMDGQFR